MIEEINCLSVCNSFFVFMALCNYDQQSYFRDVFDPLKDFRWQHLYEIPETLQQEYDPVGFWYFHHKNVHAILTDLRRVNKRVDLRDLLREMDRIWRYNNQQHRLLNEPDWRGAEEVSQRVHQLTQITRARLNLENRVENQVSSDVIRTWEYQEPLPLPTVTKGTLTGQVALRHPQIMKTETNPPFNHIKSFDKRIFIMNPPEANPN